MKMTAQQWINTCKYDEEVGYYMYKDTHYETIEDILQIAIFGFCGCGCPENNLKYIRDGLEHIEWRMDSYRNKDNELSYEQLQAKAVEIFGNESAAYFFYYWCDTKDLTEHGGSVPGWLSEHGKTMLEVLKTLKLD